MAACNNSLRFLPAFAFYVWIALTAASSAESGQKHPSAKVVIADVANKVEAVEQGKSPRPLKKKDIISENHTVIAGEASTATLVFSNGSTINVVEKSTLVISEFLQNPFSTPFAMAIATEEPTTSTTKLNLKNGEVVCKVKKLRIDEGSSLTVETPVGAAGVRGTTFAVSYLPNQNGTDTGTYILSVSEGEVSLTDNEGNLTLVTAGKEIVIIFRTKVDPLTGKTIVIEIISKQIRDIPADRLNMIKRVEAKGEADAEWVIFEPTEADILQVIQFSEERPPLINPRPVTEVDPQANGFPD